MECNVGAGVPLVRFDLTVIDTNATDGSRRLDDVGVAVLDAYPDDLDIGLTRDDVAVCVMVSGTQVCK